MRRAPLALVPALVLILGFLPANAAPQDVPDRQISHGSDTGPDDGGGKAHLDQHGPQSGHLPPSKENVTVRGRLKLTDFDGDISDVSALQSQGDGKWYAYLGDWGAHCPTGGVHVVDISRPANPRKVTFLDSGGSGYVTEGLHALRVDTPSFDGDLLVVSNEWCSAQPFARNMPGGITMWDITQPRRPERLVRGFGDFDVHGDRANESHSAIAWDAGDNAYVAMIDNEEIEDVDIVDITDPRNPVLIAETDLPGVNVNGFGDNKTSHDYDVLQFPDGTWHLMVSDWDAGWIDVDVTDPSNPVVVRDFDYAECDQVIAAELAKCLQPEGNAHQGEWNGDGTLFLGTDEDFSPYRLSPITVTEHTTADGGVPNQPAVGTEYEGGEFGFTVPIATIPDGILNGPTLFGGYGCPEDEGDIPDASVLDPFIDEGAASPEERILVTQRGPVNDPNADFDACFFSDKIRAGEERGYDAIVVANHHNGAGEGASPDAFICGGQGSPVLGTGHGLCTGHRAMHELFGRTPDYTVPYPEGDPGDLEPNPGDVGPKVTVTAEFDGWGYVRLIDSTTMTEIDQYYIPEAFDEAHATGSGDLTVHEVEVPRGDPNEGGPAPDDGDLAYFSYYSGGFRVARFDETGIEEVGHHISRGGNNHWGVALAEDQRGNRIILASDRDFGLFIYRYTGP